MSNHLRSPVADAESIPGGDAIDFLQKCLDHYNQQSIAGYSLIMHKQERIGGKLQPSEEIEVSFRTNLTVFSCTGRAVRG